MSLFAALAGAAHATTYRSILTPGPVQEIALGDELSCQVAYVNDTDLEFFPPSTTPGDCGTAVAVNGTLYAPDFGSHGSSATWNLDGYVPFTPVSQTPVLGAGTVADPYRVTTVVDAGSSGLRIAEQTTYVAGSNSYRIDTTVTNSGGGAVNAVLYHAGDCYASGSDIGYGFTRPELGTAGCSQTPQNSPPARTVQMAPLSAGSQFYEAFYGDVWTQIATRAPFPNTCRCGEHIDNGVGLSWLLSFAPGSTTTRSLIVSFTESTPPPAGLDSDGDALPDQWEAGSGSAADYENLAPLGASPTRKDVFVHLDYMAGCKPPAGWERNAMQAFADHGIALHIDAGPDSLRDLAGNTWGALSRAGEIAYQDDVALWSGFDDLKDARFVASNRRRAFHYAVIVNRANGSDGSSSRGIIEADFVLSACNVPSWVKLANKKRFVAAAFVHELGHNLGLRHGGGDDYNGKPNYYGIMNYYWALFGGIGGKDGKPGSLPDYSSSVRPEIEEERVDERVPQLLPLAWNCPGDENKPNDALDVRYEFGAEPRLIDWDCDGITGERPRKLNLNSTWNDYLGGPRETALKGYNDWRPGALQFGGAGVIGDFDVPERPNPPVVPELTGAELTGVHNALLRNRRESRQQLVVEANRRRLRPGRATPVRIAVETGAGKKVRGATVRVRGAAVVDAPAGKRRRGGRDRSRPNRGGQVLRTDRQGRALLNLRPGKGGEVRIFAGKRGLERGGVILAVGQPKAGKRKGKR